MRAVAAGDAEPLLEEDPACFEHRVGPPPVRRGHGNSPGEDIREFLAGILPIESAREIPQFIEDVRLSILRIRKG